MVPTLRDEHGGVDTDDRVRGGHERRAECANGRQEIGAGIADAGRNSDLPEKIEPTCMAKLVRVLSRGEMHTYR